MACFCTASHVPVYQIQRPCFSFLWERDRKMAEMISTISWSLSSTNSDVVHIVYKSETGGNGMRALWHPVVVEKNYSLVSQWQKTSQAMIVMLRESLIIIFSLTQRGEKFYVIHPFPPHFIGTHITYGCFLVNCWWWWAAGRFHLSRLCIFLVTLTDQTM